ncbi:glycoside hydrolase family 28 protein [Parabacteroides sp. FAFU027]|uniref:rhamnogalacturonidase n=1 Tax=Parabacteroides sp. FAFU027 TaxID=2922715 RepID=UPI001FAF1A93|nr:glycoside hydrolase family 28 protein [Parabacteroides sp. FAFU027]
MKKYIVLILSLVALQLQASPFYNVKDYGAKGDGKTIDSPAINKAIETAAQSGGGTVIFPAGTYASYSVRLKSNITLQIEAGATLLAAYPENGIGYDAAEPNDFNKFQDFGHSHWQNSLIWGENLENITICGQGLINGYGLTRGESRLPGVGNKAVSLKLCRNVVMRDLKMLNCGHFALLATGVDNMTIDNLLIDTNRDGLDIDCCRNVRVSNCSVNSPWDDAIVLKASYGLGFFRDTENVTITNCYVSGYDRGSVLNGTFQRDEPQAPDQGLVTGRIKCGTESSGGFRNIAISNCVFERCRGFALETVDGGVLEDIVVSNLTMRDIVNSPIFLRLGARLRSPEGTPVGRMKRITIDNVNVYNADSRYGCLISGLPGHYIEDVKLSNIRILYKGGGTAEQAKLTPPESEKLYPEPWMFGIIPSSSFYIRHAKNIEVKDVEVSFMQPDYRPSIQLDDVKGSRFNNVRINQPEAPKKFAVINSDEPAIRN